MKYFLTETERKASGSTYYFEFQQGKYRGKSWLKDSVCLHGDTVDELLLYKLFSKSLKDFEFFGVTEVNKEQWNCLVKNSAKNETWNEIIAELTPWVEACFQKHRWFTICGI